MPAPLWQKSSYCGEGNACVNIAASPDGTVLLRESDEPRSILTASPAALRALILGIKAGEMT